MTMGANLEVDGSEWKCDMYCKKLIWFVMAVSSEERCDQGE